MRSTPGDESSAGAIASFGGDGGPSPDRASKAALVGERTASHHTAALALGRSRSSRPSRNGQDLQREIQPVTKPGLEREGRIGYGRAPRAACGQEASRGRAICAER